jgi:hypothetical protein
MHSASLALFVWGFEPAFAFEKAKNKSKGSKTTAALGQKLLAYQTG